MSPSAFHAGSVGRGWPVPSSRYRGVASLPSTSWSGPPPEESVCSLESFRRGRDCRDHRMPKVDGRDSDPAWGGTGGGGFCCGFGSGGFGCGGLGWGGLGCWGWAPAGGGGICCGICDTILIGIGFTVTGLGVTAHHTSSIRMSRLTATDKTVATTRPLVFFPAVPPKAAVRLYPLRPVLTASWRAPPRREPPP